MTTANSESSDHCRPRAVSHSARGPGKRVTPMWTTVCGLLGHQVSHHFQIRINPNTGCAIRVLR